MEHRESRKNWSMVLQSTDRNSGSSGPESFDLPADRVLAAFLCAEIERRHEYLEVPVQLQGEFNELDTAGQEAWISFATVIPLKLSSLNLGVRKCEAIYKTCIITDDEIDKLARFDYRNYMEVHSVTGTPNPAYESLADGKRNFFKELNYLIPFLLKEHDYEVFRPGEGTEIDESMVTRIARAIHAIYIAETRRISDGKKNLEFHAEWDRLSDEVKASNLDNARHIPTKLMAIGYRIEPEVEGYRAATLVLDDQEIETMARVEHMRWCWEKRINGWISGSKTDGEMKVHEGLVPYSMLSETEKRKDRELVRLIPALLQDLDLIAVPVGRDRISGLPYAIRPESAVDRIVRMARELDEEIAQLDLPPGSAGAILENRVRSLGKAAFELKNSYDYARHIQETFLPEDLRVRESFPGSFILYRPKDIVGGDFYYFHTRGNTSIFAAADCTGHGIPGALLSTIGYAFLDQAVSELGIAGPSEILDHLYSRIHRFLRRYEEGTYLSDDLDIALCAYDHNSRLLRFSAVGNPLYRISHASGKLIRYRTVNQPDQGGNGNMPHYEELEIPLDFGDVLYLGSDGFADQFGGKPRKRYGGSRLRRLLQEISTLSMPRQKEQMELAIEKWKETANEPQTDDMLMIGIRI
jgi:serine phosphatase RsbU (regulator of sigma subunit)